MSFVIENIKVNGNKYWYDFMTGKYGESTNIKRNTQVLRQNDFNEVKKKSTQIMSSFNFICITIMTTSLCNFKCSYCFEENEDITLKNSSISKIINLIQEYKKTYPKTEKLVIIWFGGEPSLTLDFILSLNSEIKIISNELGLEYTSRMITNGFLLDEVNPLICELNLTDIQITLDGLRTTHNSRRIHKSKGNTFDTIIENINKINFAVDLIIRVNVDSHNLNEIIELRKYILELTVYKNVKIYFQPMLVENYGGDSSCYLGKVLKDKRIYLEYLNLLNEIGYIEQPKFLGAFCNVNFPTTCVITSSGKVVKCWADINDKNSYELDIYNSSPKKIIDSFSNNRFKVRYQKCFQCFAFPACLGGCQFQNYSDEDCKTRKEMVLLQAKNYIEYEIGKNSYG